MRIVPEDVSRTPPAPSRRPLAPPARAAEPVEATFSELRRRRDELAEQVAEMHWDLGGLAYEMAIRDHFRLDVLVRRAAMLQERDGELAEVERLLAMEEGAIAGHCARCSAPHSRGAVYCWQCGTALMAHAASQMLGAQDAPTAVMGALLAPPESSSAEQE